MIDLTIERPGPHHRFDSRVRRDRNAPKPYEHVVRVSGGKDSTALYCLAVERGMPFRAVMADTGHEHPWTYEHAAEMPARIGGPPIEMVKADFTEAMDRKRAFILKHWERRGVPVALVERAAQLLRPTGIPFLDLCMVKGRFPGAKSKFCTEELKLVPMWYGIDAPLFEQGRAIISWQGVRAQESLARRYLTSWQRIANPAPFCLPKAERDAVLAAGYDYFTYRPLIAWTVEDVFRMHDRHGVKPNPLYPMGVSRVGCWPCIHATKDELRVFARISPEGVERVEEWERIVGMVSKRCLLLGLDLATFFCVSDDPLYEEGMTIDAESFGIRAKIEWAKTSRGGRQYDMLARWELGASCTEVGVCE